jgi:hypothetical protein
VDVLGHHHVAQYRHSIPSTDGFERGLELIRGPMVAQVGETLVAAEREKVEIAGLLVTMESARHDGSD